MLELYLYFKVKFESSRVSRQNRHITTLFCMILRLENVVEIGPYMDVFLIVVLRPTIRLFCSLFKIRRHVIGCINHYMVVGICSKILMRLSY